MHKVSEISAWMNKFAPSRLAESWDNVGLLWGDPSEPVHRIMTCLTVTHESAAEAIGAGVNLIVSHHPILFRGAKAIRADQHETAFLWKLARAGVAIYSPHTAFDNTKGGINDILAERLGLSNVKGLRKPTRITAHKVTVFAPLSDREAVMNAMFAAGAGQIGNYSECSFGVTGQGTFFGNDQTNPTIGEPGGRELVEECRIETVCPADKLDAVIQAMIRAHSYEEPAYDVYTVSAPSPDLGSGRVGDLQTATSLKAFAQTVSRVLNAPGVQFVGDPDWVVEKVAIVCGAGDDFLQDAVRTKADVLLTGESRFHRGWEALAQQTGMVVAGHHATERIGVEVLAEKLKAAFPTVEVWASRQEFDPFRTLELS